METIEKRKRKTEEYACDEERKVGATRKKLKDAYRWNHDISNGIKKDCLEQDFLSKIPHSVLLDFVRKRSTDFGVFLNTRRTWLDSWITETNAYQKHSDIWLERKLEHVRQGVIPFKTLRYYRERNIPLAVEIFPCNPHGLQLKRISLPYGSYAFVKQVFSRSLKLYISGNHGGSGISLADAWAIVAGPSLSSRNDRAVVEKRIREWDENPCDDRIFLHAFSRIVAHAEASTIRTSNKTKFWTQIATTTPGEYCRSIRFYFGPDCVEQYDAIEECYHFPHELTTCITGYLQPTYFLPTE
jgi:hypothetical protein